MLKLQNMTKIVKMGNSIKTTINYHKNKINKTKFKKTVEAVLFLFYSVRLLYIKSAFGADSRCNFIRVGS